MYLEDHIYAWFLLFLYLLNKTNHIILYIYNMFFSIWQNVHVETSGLHSVASKNFAHRGVLLELRQRYFPTLSINARVEPGGSLEMSRCGTRS